MLTAKLAQNQLKSASKVNRNPARISLEPESGPRRNWRENFAGTGAWTKAELEGEFCWNRSLGQGGIGGRISLEPESERKQNPSETGCKTSVGTRNQTVIRVRI